MRTLAVILAVILIVGAFFVGRFLFPILSIQTVTRIEYVKVPYKVVDSIAYPIPQEIRVVIKDSISLKNALLKLDKIKDSLIIAQLEIRDLKRIISDTLEGYKDWLRIIKYEKTLFDNDSIGRFNLSWHNQFNRTWNLKYSFEPIIKQVTVTNTIQPKDFSMFIFTGLGTDKSLHIRPGLFYKKIGFQYGYRYSLEAKQNIHELSVGFKLFR